MDRKKKNKNTYNVSVEQWEVKRIFWSINIETPQYENFLKGYTSNKKGKYINA